MPSIWIGALLSGLVIALAAATVGAVAGSGWGWMAATSGLAILGLHHLGNLTKLARWVGLPPGSAVPHGSGIWGWIYSALYRRDKAAVADTRRLESAVSRLAAAAHALPDGVVIIDAATAIEWLNDTAARHLGLDPQRDLGSPLTNFVRRPEFAAYLHGGCYDEPLILRGSRIAGATLALQVVPFGVERRLILTRDITQIERLETMRRDFVANVSHELKTPLTVVGGFIETLADNLPVMSAEEADRFLRLALDQSRRMERLVEDLLTLSRLETAAAPAVEEEVDVLALMAEVSREAQALSAGRHPIEVRPGPPARLLGSAAELRSAFSNLASNAVRYTPSGGRIALAWSVEDDGSGVFAVEDAGIGIDAAHLPRLTERFYRVDRGRSRETGGTGLGLAIVKHVLSRHDARLEVASTPGRGSRFAAHFPAARVSSTRREVAPVRS